MLLLLLLFSNWLAGLVILRGADAYPTTNHTIHSPRDVGGVTIPAGFSRCLFFDDFSDQPVGFLPSASKWTLDLGTSYPRGPQRWGTGEIQTYTSDRSNIAITDRQTLQITPIRLADGMWTSSRIETTAQWDFGCPAGRRIRVEARIRLGSDPGPRQQGIWPAFWALGSDLRGNYWNWPRVGEIDMMESVNGEARVRRAAHCGIAPGGPCNEFSGLGNVAEHRLERGKWHTFAWEVDRRRRERRDETLTWYVDGAQQWTLTESDVRDESAWDVLVDHKKMLLFNVAVGGALPDAIAGIKTPTGATAGGRGASMEVDHVAVFEQL
ncbi:glycosyl hydrolases family 16 domain-containing protein [Hirsutella rhossiliensis]|uniref:Glycosyl hydrolases family 16 domain-containing protein n=1 Tax=Hirsutella rhossiliensis TaxID=111463 RepID=A0A9P8SDP1_9HYPO|nr:glycosyl hydrolases family 16 domain-containing protein [Hirsutella rhossiliensis]KAH0958953.1 glycosyl hydrolases family 16 domain-containing protein [Hirsutella rhossiliensis]